MEKHEIPAARNQVNDVFDTMNKKLTLLLSEYNLSKIERDEAITHLIGHNEEIRKGFLKEWHMVEAQDKIITKLEYYLEVFGNDVESVRAKIMEDKEIVAHLNETK